MEILTIILITAQLVFTVTAFLYFFNGVKTQSTAKTSVVIDSKKESSRLESLKKVSLTLPLSEKTRPSAMEDVIGQEEGIKALRAVFCGKNPQHVLIYGPAGVGKTAAARLVLEEAKMNPDSPFGKEAKFIEIDATTLRFDERSIADPLIGSVHDPIYQGAGALGNAGIPQPKEGAVTKAHGGALFIDEIGELNPIQMNKLLKVLEDRKVFLNSAYYSSENTQIPEYIHDIFDNGLPADFRLIGATTRSPEDIPQALRSRCCEIFFDKLKTNDIKKIAKGAAVNTGMECDENAFDIVAQFSGNGRDTVNIMQTAASLALYEKRKNITCSDIQWVVKSGRYNKLIKNKVCDKAKCGAVNGLAVLPDGTGMLLKIEASAVKSISGGKITAAGIIENEDIKRGSVTMKRTSCAKSSVENAAAAIKYLTGIDTAEYDIHINFPGGVPVDGPSAGAAIFCAMYSAMTGKEIDPHTALTGEISIFGEVLPVGGVEEKVQAAVEAGAELVFVPDQNFNSSLLNFGAEVVAANNINQVLERIFAEEIKESEENILTAKGAV
ncbi:ATP-dependent protease LonB [Lachnospiraceae bacterium NSJ-143]|nr:ATP-dependent protease LonB [Lachnospiraceae bacterium NSJ-143]